MRIVGLIPIKAESKRVPGKNFRLLSGRPLFHYIVEAACNAGLSQVYLNTDSEIAKEYARKSGIPVIDRPAWLSADSANGNHLLVYESSIVEADVYIQLFATAPLLSSHTIRTAADVLSADSAYDSVFTVNVIHSWFWFDGKPINYDPRVLPRSQDAKPIVRETTGLYAIRRDALLDRKCRIGHRPFLLRVSEFEGVDIDTEFDFKYAEYLVQKKAAGELPDLITDPAPLGPPAYDAPNA